MCRLSPWFCLSPEVACLGFLSLRLGLNTNADVFLSAWKGSCDDESSVLGRKRNGTGIERLGLAVGTWWEPAWPFLNLRCCASGAGVLWEALRSGGPRLLCGSSTFPAPRAASASAFYPSWWPQELESGHEASPRSAGLACGTSPGTEDPEPADPAEPPGAGR